jgi:hypothetical protein
MADSGCESHAAKYAVRKLLSAVVLASLSGCPSPIDKALVRVVEDQLVPVVAVLSPDIS